MFRLRVCNEGNEAANAVEIHLVDVSLIRRDGSFERDQRFVPVRLRWSHDGTALKENLSPQISGLVDLGELRANWHATAVPGAEQPTPPASLGSGVQFNRPWLRTQLALSTEVAALTDIWTYGPGSYRLKLAVSCTRGVLWKGVVELTFSSASVEHDAETGALRLAYNCRIVCGCPEIGLDVCHCG